MATPRMEGLGRFALRGLPIAPGNMSLVELLKPFVPAELRNA